MKVQTHSTARRETGQPASKLKLGRLSWTPLSEEIKRSDTEPAERYLHTAVAAKDKLYVLGGADSRGALQTNRLFCCDTASRKWTTFDIADYCEGRSGHVSAFLKNELYFFGGCLNGHSTHDFFKFNPVTKTWTLLQSESNVPTPREQPLFTAFNDSFLFLYGGIDLQLDQIYSDAFVFRNGSWNPIKVNNILSPRIKIGSAQCGNRMFLFGGEGPSEDIPLLFNDVHQVVINDITLEATIKEVNVACVRPMKRTSHGLASVSDELLLLYGGQTCDNFGSYVALRDLWMLDIKELQWTEVQTLQGPMSPRYEFSFSVCSSQIYIFGGFNENNVVINSLVKLQYLPQKQIAFDVCEDCYSTFESNLLKKDVESIKEITISVGFLHNMALEVGFPFRAMEMIIDSAAMLGSKAITLSTAKSKEDFDLLVFQFDSEEQIPDSIFLKMVESYTCANFASIVYQMKLGAFRLGKTMLYITADKQSRKVFLASVDNKVTPNFEEQIGYFSYIQDIESGNLIPANGMLRKQTIFNFLKIHFQDPNTILSRRQGHLLIIFEVNILPTAQKAYYYELINYKQPENDIKLYCNEKKIEFLEGLGLSISQTPDFSLRTYLSLAKIERNIQIYINSNKDQPVDCYNYLEILQQYRRAELVEALQCDLTNKYVEKCFLFQCRSDTNLSCNYGVLIYCGNQLFDRFKYPFGQLMSSKFYKKKFKTTDFSQNLFEFMGVVYLSADIGLSKSRSKVKKHFQYVKILQEITKFLKGKKVGPESADKELSILYQSRFSLNKEGSKRRKRELPQ